MHGQPRRRPLPRPVGADRARRARRTISIALPTSGSGRYAFRSSGSEPHRRPGARRLALARRAARARASARDRPDRRCWCTMAAGRQIPTCSTRAFPSGSRTMPAPSRSAIPGSPPIPRSMSRSRPPGSARCTASGTRTPDANVISHGRCSPSVAPSVLAMRAIREVNPHAAFVQTEDLGRTYSTPLLDYQADFDNDRRWLSFDLLTGRLGRRTGCGATCAISVFPRKTPAVVPAKMSCPPDILGINHYLTSNRYLDTDLGSLSRQTRGAETAATATPTWPPYASSRPRRVSAMLLAEAWKRYRIPLAVTEAHLGCTREEQLDGCSEVWRDAGRARARRCGRPCRHRLGAARVLRLGFAAHSGARATTSPAPSTCAARRRVRRRSAT